MVAAQLIGGAASRKLDGSAEYIIDEQTGSRGRQMAAGGRQYYMR